jgi:hypothetical protein
VAETQEGRLVPMSVPLHVLTIPPDAALRELSKWTETLLKEMPTSEELKGLLQRLSELVQLLDGFANQAERLFATHGTRAVSPQAIPEAFRNYATTLLLTLTHILEDLRRQIDGVDLVPENALKVAQLVDGFVVADQIVLTALPRMMQVLLNILARNIPDLSQRSAVTFEPMGRAVLKTR